MQGSNGSKESKLVAVFGSANTQPGTPDYQDALTVGAEVARAGHAVITGGYSGIMGAASQGAHQVGGRVLGVTVGLFKSRGLVPNAYLSEEIHLETLSERLNYLVVKPDAYVIMRGGVGTLSEMTLAWSLLQVGEIPARPMVLVGEMWKAIILPFSQYSTVNPRDMRWLILVDRVQEVVPALQNWWASPPNIPLRTGDESAPSNKS